MRGTEFYLNVVGYKEYDRLRRWSPSEKFYLNVVGYKARKQLDECVGVLLVLSERSGI